MDLEVLLDFGERCIVHFLHLLLLPVSRESLEGRDFLTAREDEHAVCTDAEGRCASSRMAAAPGMKPVVPSITIYSCFSTL